ncbi:hypothetical protein GOP47_0008171 [Adiantum capillus-veneris]|uniref:Uncharacterized protein n=1 Tax=Adiantum capillus-veneris TaxID=13818 RepID=A0A9D4ZK69_ADICA|nr:hypothetical protein GOP47_0008171 [Adiantum capillus-veneris]
MVRDVPVVVKVQESKPLVEKTTLQNPSEWRAQNCFAASFCFNKPGYHLVPRNLAGAAIERWNRQGSTSP